MIHRVAIRNFKNIRDQSIDLGRLTVFVGANSSGKTSVLDAIHLAVRAAATGEAGKVFGPRYHCDWLYTRGSQGDLAISCTTESGTFCVSATPPPEFPPIPELLGRSEWRFEVSSQNAVPPTHAVRPARSLVFLHLNSAELGKPSYVDRDPPRVEHNGENLASVLAYMALFVPDQFEQIIALMREFIPQLKRIRFRKVPVVRQEKELVRFGEEAFQRQTRRRYLGEAMLFDFEHAENLDARTLSEGSLLLLGLLTVLLGPDRPRIVLLDDIEHGLHPLAQATLLRTIRRLMEKIPDLQILGTAHSPYLLDHLEPHEVRLMAVGDDGYAVCGRLEGHPQFERWKDEMAPGELWSLFGEKWIAEKGATP
jgi:predicted ATPase